MADKLSDAQIVQRMMLLKRAKNNQSKAAQMAGCNRQSFMAAIHEGQRRGLTADSRVMSDADKWEQRARMAETELAAVERVNLEASNIRQEIYGLSEMVMDPPQWAVKFREPKSSGVPIFHWSDWHYGETVTRSELEGKNEFNRSIGQKRVRRLVETCIDLAKNHMVKAKYPGAVICLGGDMITGAIHDDLKETNDGSVQQSCLEVQQLLAWALNEMARTFKKLLVVCVVGNHARGTPKVRFKRHVVQSFEWNVYQQLNLWFARDRRIQFIIPDSSDALFTVAGHRYLLTHGDMLGVKGGDGIIGALGPITRGAIKVGRQQAQIGRDFDTLIMGHWHTYIPRSRASAVACNGTLKGYDEYAHLALRVPYSPPSQSLWFTHPVYGVTCQWEILLEGDRAAKETAPWVEWQDRRAA